MALWKKPFEGQAAKSGAKDGTAGRNSAANSSEHPAESEPASGTSKALRANGTAPELKPEQLNKMAAASKALTAALGEIAALLMHSPQYKYYTLADLEWLIVPALSTGQFSLATAQSKANGLTSPVGLVLWASVSEDVDKRLSAAAAQPLRLKPQDWKSGDILWVILALGDQRVVQGMLKGIQDKQWGRKPARAYVRDKEGKPTIVTIESKAA